MIMKTRTIILLAILAIGLAVFSAKVVLFLTAKPKVTIDYVAEYNAITFPANYDPNENAALYYQKALDTFVEMPRQLIGGGRGWPADFNDTQQVFFRAWLASNSRAFEQFKIGAKKPYCWWQRQATHGCGMSELLFQEKYPPRHIIAAFMWKTKQDAVEERKQAVFDNILDCYKAGGQQCQTPSLLAVQEFGLDFKRIAMSAALVILDKVVFDSVTLKSFQDMLKTELDKDTYLPDLEAEKLLHNDLLQMVFVYNSNGTGRLTWNTAKDFIGACGQWNIFEVLRYCLIGPTQNQIAGQINELFASFDSIKSKTPKQLYSYDHNYFMKIDTACQDDLFFGFSALNLHKIYYLYHKTRSRTEAVITVVAILRYKTDAGQYPESLDKLVSAGYLQSVPMDPYSDGPLVYKIAEDNFKLYSVGENFIDDGGIAFPSSSGDIVYWPVRRPETPKSSEETETVQKNPEPNQAE